MRKRIGTATHHETSAAGEQWLDLERCAQVEVSSEDAAHSIEAALIPGRGEGWRAGGPGEQTIRLLFDEPRPIRHVRLLFLESQTERRQEIVLRWSAGEGEAFREIVRQQYHFSPAGAVRELEEYHVELDDVGALELTIIPDISGGEACASLAQLRLA